MNSCVASLVLGARDPQDPPLLFRGSKAFLSEYFSANDLDRSHQGDISHTCARARVRNIIYSSLGQIIP